MAFGKSLGDPIRSRERAYFRAAVPLLLFGILGAKIVDWRSAGDVVGFVLAALVVGYWSLAARRAAERTAKQGAPPPLPPSANQPSPGQVSALEPSPGQFRVPEEHVIHRYSAAPVPNLVQSVSGIWVASLGLGGDEPEEELADLAQKLAAGLRQPAKTLMATQCGPLSDLCAPHDPQVTTAPRLVVWSAPEGSLGWWGEAPSRLQALLEHFSQLNVPQIVFLAENGGPNALLIARLLSGLGVQVRRALADRTVLAEVERPEGVILSAVPGAPLLDDDEPADPYLQTVADKKAEARAHGDQAGLQRLIEQERIYLAERLVRAGSPNPPEPVIRLTRLRRLLLGVAQGGDADTRQALYAELLERQFPFAIKSDAQGNVQKVSWPGHAHAIVAFPCLLYLRLAAEDDGKVQTTYAFAAMSPMKLFAWALECQAEVALNVYDESGMPLHVFLSVADLSALAKGQLPVNQHDLT